MRTTTRTTRRRLGLLAGVSIVLLFSSAPRQQEPRPLTAEDYGRWESLGFGEAISPDGRWLAYPIRRSNGEDELRVTSTLDDRRTAQPFGRDAEFSSDSRWVAYRIGFSEEETARREEADEPIRERLGLLRLDEALEVEEMPDVEEIPDVERFAFAASGRHLAYRRYAATAEDGSGGASDTADEAASVAASAVPDPHGADLVVRDLDSGAEIAFADVDEFAWQDETGILLAMTVAGTDRAGNGVRLYDAATGTVRALHSGRAVYRGLAWRPGGDDLAVLRSGAAERFEGDTHTILVWRGLSEPDPRMLEYDQNDDPGFPSSTRIVASRTPGWSDGGDVLFVGVRSWLPRSEPDAPAEDETADVDVWHARDRRIVPMQKLQKERDEARSLLAAWHLDAGRFVRLGTDLMEDVEPAPGHAVAVARHTEPYTLDEMFGRGRMDVHVIDVSTGERTTAVRRVRHLHDASPGGRYLLYFRDGDFWTYEIATGRRTNITGALDAAFLDADYDLPTDDGPAYGVGAWAASEEWVLLHDRDDVWRVAADGSGGVNVTAGGGTEVRHRFVDPRPDEPAATDGLPDDEPFYVSLYGRWTKQHGYGRLASPLDAGVERLVWLEKSVGRLRAAEDAPRYAYVVQAFDDSPDYFVGGPVLSDARRVSETNPFQREYAWGRASLVDYRTPDGVRLQAALTAPAGYVPGRRYPMIVYVYERRSQLVHQYAAPSERTPYNPTVFASAGYFVLQPDIVYRDRDPGVSATECVVAAVEAALATGMIDPDRVGLVGHSWGGYEASFIPTQTDLFAAAIAGAPLTNFFSMFGTIHWNQGMPEAAHFETGQARMDVPYWEDMDAYVRNSPVMFVTELDTPMLVAFGDADGTVDWHQGVELYNYARRAGKQLVMLVYAGENHGLRKRPNQIDYHRRILQWFGHYLKDEVPPAWITEGVRVSPAVPSP